MVRLDKIEDSLDQLRLTTAKLEGTTETIQKLLGGGLVFVGLLAAAGLFGIFLP